MSIKRQRIAKAAHVLGVEYAVLEQALNESAKSAEQPDDCRKAFEAKCKEMEWDAGNMLIWIGWEAAWQPTRESVSLDRCINAAAEVDKEPFVGYRSIVIAILTIAGVPYHE